MAQKFFNVNLVEDFWKCRIPKMRMDSKGENGKRNLKDIGKKNCMIEFDRRIDAEEKKMELKIKKVSNVSEKSGRRIICNRCKWCTGGVENLSVEQT